MCSGSYDSNYEKPITPETVKYPSSEQAALKDSARSAAMRRYGANASNQTQGLVRTADANTKKATLGGGEKQA